MDLDCFCQRSQGLLPMPIRRIPLERHPFGEGILQRSPWDLRGGEGMPLAWGGAPPRRTEKQKKCQPGKPDQEERRHSGNYLHNSLIFLVIIMPAINGRCIDNLYRCQSKGFPGKGPKDSFGASPRKNKLIQSKAETHMPRASPRIIESQNCRVRHYLARFKS